LDEHVAILEAIEAGKEDVAIDTLKSHLTNVDGRFKKVMIATRTQEEVQEIKPIGG
jgi:DNA-binding GntR family transcriptional regulator